MVVVMRWRFIVVQWNVAAESKRAQRPQFRKLKTLRAKESKNKNKTKIKIKVKIKIKIKNK